MGGGYRTGGPDRSDEYEDRRPPREDRADAIQAVQEAAAAAQAAMNRRNRDDETEGTDTESPGATSVREIDGIGKTKGNALEEAGYRTVADLRTASREQLLAVSGIGPQTADLLQAAANERAPSVPVQIDEDVKRAIEETAIVETAAADTEELRTLFRSSAREFASRIKNPIVARRVFEHVYELRQHDDGPGTGITAGTNRTETRVTLTRESTRTDAIHEYAHLFADAYGYTDGTKGTNAARTYRDVQSDPQTLNDPFVVVDPTESECQLSQEQGEVVEDTSQEIQQLMQAVNEAWARLQRRAQAGENPRQYNVLDNYSATSASEFLAQLNEFMQSSTVPENGGEFFRTQPEVVEAYRDVFEPSDPIQALLEEITGG